MYVQRKFCKCMAQMLQNVIIKSSNIVIKTIATVVKVFFTTVFAETSCFFALTLGVLGAGLAFGAEWLMYEALRANLDTIDTLQLFNFVPFTDLLLPMIITFASAGLFVGFLGSWTSIRKFMDV